MTSNAQRDIASIATTYGELEVGDRIDVSNPRVPAALQGFPRVTVTAYDKSLGSVAVVTVRTTDKALPVTLVKLTTAPVIRSTRS